MHDVGPRPGRKVAHTLKQPVIDGSTSKEWGFDAPEWVDLVRGVRPGYDPLVDDMPRLSTQGGQHFTSKTIEPSFLVDTIWPRLDVPHQALMRSRNPMAAIPFTCMPLFSESRFQPQEFRVLPLKRLWQPLPLSSSICRCDRPLDSRDHNRAVCSVVGVFGTSVFALESAAARVCREASGR